RVIQQLWMSPHTLLASATAARPGPQLRLCARFIALTCFRFLSKTWTEGSGAESRSIQMHSFARLSKSDGVDSATNTRRKECDFKAERLEQGRECAVQFVAESTPSLFDNLANECIWIERDSAPEPYVQVFERNRKHVSAMNLAQSLSCGPGRAAVADASKVCGDIHSCWITRN